MMGMYNQLVRLRNLGKGLPPESEPEALCNRIEIALLAGFVFVHPVLKWLHHPLSKKVMLLHSETSSHDFLHSAMLASTPGD